MQHNPIQLAVIDMAGTTVADDGLVVNAFEAAATAVGVPASGPEREQRPAVRPRHHGPVQDQRLPRTVRQRGAAPSGPTPPSSAHTKQLIDEGNAAPIDGAAEAITRLRENGSGRAHHRVQRHHPGEAAGRAGLAVLGRPGARAGRRACGVGPTPTSSSLRSCDCEVDGVTNVATLGDTSNDIESALRAGGAIAAGTLTGAHDEQRLRAAGATHVVGSVTAFADLILQDR